MLGDLFQGHAVDVMKRCDELVDVDSRRSGLEYLRDRCALVFIKISDLEKGLVEVVLGLSLS